MRKTTIGKLRDRITLEAWQPTRDSLGQEKGSWSAVGVLWSNVEQQTGTETVEAQENVATLQCLVTIRYLPNVGPQHRVVWDGKPMGIASVRDIDGKKRYLELACVKAA